MNIFKKIVFIVVLGSSSLQASERTMIMLFDKDGEQKDFAIKEYFLKALYENKSPILISSLILKNILTTEKVINNVLSTCDQDEAYCFTLHEANALIHKESLSDRDLRSFLTGLNINMEDIVKQPSSPQIFFALNVKLNNFNQDKWKIYSIDDQFLLLIPNSLMHTLDADSSLKALTLDQKLGINVSKLPEVSSADILNNTFRANKNSALRDPEKLTMLLEKIFITKKNMINNHSIDWYFYLVGHGNPPSLKNAALLPQFYVLKKLIATEKNIQKRAAYQKEFIALSNEIKEGANATIAGMSLGAFEQLLNFFNNKLSTKFLYYTSCFSGGLNIELPFLNANLEGYVYNYTIISQSITNQSTYQKRWFEGKTISTIAHNNNSVTLNTKLDFQKFFEDLIGNKPFLNVVEHITNTMISSSYIELPTIRYKNTPLFIPLDVNIGDSPAVTKTLNLTNIRLKQLLLEKKPINLYSQTIAIINQNYMPIPINIFDKKTAIIAKSNYVPVVFETINAPKLSLADLIAVFNKKIDQPILIKNLIINMGSVVTLQHVMIDLQTTIFTSFRNLFKGKRPDIYITFERNKDLYLVEFDQKKQTVIVDEDHIYRGKIKDTYHKLFDTIYATLKKIENTDIASLTVLHEMLEKKKLQTVAGAGA